LLCEKLCHAAAYADYSATAGFFRQLVCCPYLD